MKKIILPIIFLFFGITSLFSQISDFVFFSEDGYPFSLIMNGVKQNDKPQTNVKVTGLSSPSYKIKIIFEDKTKPSINKVVYTKPGLEITYRIKKNRKGENIVRYFTENPVNEIYLEKEEVVQERIIDDNNSKGIHIDVDVNETGINYNVDTPDGSVNVNANVDIYGEDVQYSENVDVNENVYIDDNPEEQIYHMPGYSGKVGCNWPMERYEFERAKNLIANKDFASDKLILAKQIINSNCFTAQYVKEIVELFDFEADRLKFAKYAYLHTFDISNYYIVNDVFEFSSSIKELDNYINSVRR